MSAKKRHRFSTAANTSIGSNDFLPSAKQNSFVFGTPQRKMTRRKTMQNKNNVGTWGTMEDKPEQLYGQSSGISTPLTTVRAPLTRRESNEFLRHLQKKATMNAKTITPQTPAGPSSVAPTPDWSSLNCDIVSCSRDDDVDGSGDEDDLDLERADETDVVVLEGTAKRRTGYQSNLASHSTQY